jgi:hypothetical protein
MNRIFSIVAAMSILAACTSVQANNPQPAAPAKVEAPAPAKVEAPAPAKVEAPAQATAKVTNKVTYKGRRGVQAFLEASASDTLPVGEVTLDAYPNDIVEGSLDSVANANGNSVGRKTVAKSMVMAAVGVAEAEEDIRPAMAETVAKTYESHVVVANGVSEVAVPAWTDAVMTRAAAKNEGKTLEAVELHASAEKRIESLRNPSWGTRFAYWWNRD